MDSGVYGIDIGSNLTNLMRCINAIDGSFRTRLGMINPQHAIKMMEQLLHELSGPRFYKFIHVPIQSGSEKVVREMGRMHTVADFENFVQHARKKIPDVTIATDVIAGYPTETEKDFEETKKLLERVRVDVVNISKFSARPGTRAKELRQLPTQTVKERSRILTKLVRKIGAEKNKQLIGKTFEVLVTEKQKSYTGRTRSYKQVVITKGKTKLGETVKVKITDANHGSLFGEKIK